MGQVDDLIEQIDEELEADRVHKYWKENQNFIISILILFFAALFAFVGWKEWRENQDKQASQLFLAALETQARGDNAQSIQLFNALDKDFASHGYAKLARLLHARALADGGDIAGAFALLEETAQNGPVHPAPMREMALLQLASLAIDDAAKARGYLNRIPAESPLKANALEIDGLLSLKAGDEAAAIARFQEARKKSPAATLTQRLDVRLDRLGASAAALNAAAPDSPVAALSAAAAESKAAPPAPTAPLQPAVPAKP